ncbi:MAG: SIMPL domain-containing protein [Pseudomonadales bacterium]|nr:SIMPL domain-containing protein [Pseudomonadales bacterium]
MTILAGVTRSALVAASLCVLGFQAAAQASTNEPYPQIIVSGEGGAEVAPDMAVLQLTVSREAETARAALDANSAAMTEVLKALRDEGIAERDLQTSNFSIQPRYSYPSPKAQGEHKPPRIVGYTVRNGLSVRIRDLARLGAIMDKSVTLGVNEGGNIQFTNDDPTAVIEQARTRAVQDAVAKAKTLAAAAGVRLGNVLEISEQSYNPAPRPMMRAAMEMGVAADAVPVAAGESRYQVTVNMSYAIEQ